MTTVKTREPLATTEEVAAYLKRKPRTLESWRNRKIGPPYKKVGTKNVVYKWSDVDAWLEAQSPAGAA